MKKLLLSMLFLFATATMVSAAIDDDRAVTFTQLPQKAQFFIKQHFAQDKISYAQQDTGMFDGNFKVYFTDGNKVEFTKKGEWEEVECKRTEVPAAIIPVRIKEFITKSHAGVRVTEINRDRRDYEVKLSDGTELKFSLKGDFMGYDH